MVYFPFSPVNDQTYTNPLGTTWRYDSTRTAWLIIGGVGMGGTGLQGITGLYGQTGIQGNTGIQGLDGETGIQGLDGQTGIQGVTGILGIDGQTGIQGIDGQTGVQGETGLTGPIGGNDTQFLYNNGGTTAGADVYYYYGSVGIGDPSALTDKLSILNSGSCGIKLDSSSDTYLNIFKSGSGWTLSFSGGDFHIGSPSDKVLINFAGDMTAIGSMIVATNVGVLRDNLDTTSFEIAASKVCRLNPSMNAYNPVIIGDATRGIVGGGDVLVTGSVRTRTGYCSADDSTGSTEDVDVAWTGGSPGDIQRMHFKNGLLTSTEIILG